jgi:hypothetical protein
MKKLIALFAIAFALVAGSAVAQQGSGVSGPPATAITNPNPYDASNAIATDAFTQNALLLSMATVPMSLATGTYSFAPTASAANYPVMNCTAVSGAETACTIFAGGSGFAVGDLIVPAGGNHDALLQVATLSGSAVATLNVVYGGTGYTTQSGVASATSSAIPYTFLLSGALSGNVTLIMTNGTYQTGSQQWFFANNTTNADTVTVCVSNGSDACSAGRSALIPQGSNNSRLVGVQTDGKLNVDIASIINANDLQGLTGTLVSVQTFTSTQTYTRSPGVTHAYVRVLGGGGAGGGAAQATAAQFTVGSGGGAGALAEGYLAPNSTETVTVGAGGTGVSGTTGGTGQTSSFGTTPFLTATGGAGGGTAATGVAVYAGGALGGTSSQSGTIASTLGTGAPGGGAFASAAPLLLQTAAGGSTAFGGGGQTGGGAGAGPAGTGYGSGGGGAASYNGSAAAAGGNGAPGRVEVREYK